MKDFPFSQRGSVTKVGRESLEPQPSGTVNLWKVLTEKSAIQHVLILFVIGFYLVAGTTIVGYELAIGEPQQAFEHLKDLFWPIITMALVWLYGKKTK